MDYNAHYKKLINRAKGRLLSGYYEVHYIIPRCMGGTDAQENLVRLTPEEHYLAHLLLCKAYPTVPSLVSAAMMMCAARKGNKVYGWLRKRHALAMSIHQSGENNSQYGTIWINKNGQARKIQKDKAESYFEDGWVLGRKPKIEKIEKIKCKGICADKYKWILDQEEKILKEFDTHRSVTKILHDRGFSNREGNKILASWLKSKGRVLLKRRNSAGVA